MNVKITKTTRPTMAGTNGIIALAGLALPLGPVASAGVGAGSSSLTGVSSSWEKIFSASAFAVGVASGATSGVVSGAALSASLPFKNSLLSETRIEGPSYFDEDPACGWTGSAWACGVTLGWADVSKVNDPAVPRFLIGAFLGNKST